MREEQRCFVGWAPPTTFMARADGEEFARAEGRFPHEPLLINH